MFPFKKLLIATIVFNAGTSFAGTVGPIESTHHTAWQFGASALYLKPSFGGYVLPGTLESVSDMSKDYANWSPDWGFGFKVDAAYLFDTSNDLTLSGYHLAHSNGFAFSDLSESEGVSNFTRTGTSDVSYNWNTVNLELGQTFHFNQSKQLRVHAGVKYARVKTDTSSDGTLSLLGEPESFSRNLIGNFYGYGPRVGVDAARDWANGLGLYTSLACSLLIGNKGFSDTIIYAGSPNTYNASYFGIASGLEAKVGAKYTHALAHGDLSVDAGWMFMDTFNALAYRLVLSTTDSATRESDFALQGPYVGLKWLGDIA